MNAASYWDSFPVMRFFLLTAFGCLLGFYAPVNPWWPASVFVLVLVANVVLNYRIVNMHDVKPWQSGLAHVLFVLVGWLICSFYLGKYAVGFFGRHAEQIVAFEATIVQDPTSKPNVFRSVAKMSRWRDTAGYWHRTEGKVLLYLFSKNLDFEPAYGQRILVVQTPVVVQTAINPGDFDFRTFLSYQGIYYQAHVPGNHVHLLEPNTGNVLMAAAIRARKSAIEIIRSTILSRQEASVAMALILGVKSFIDPEVRQAYQSAGAMHVLAVSGMHVGLVFGALTLIFGFIKKKKHGVWVFTGFIILVLWAYALVTGFSASVLRAVTMCTFVLLANGVGKHYNMFNILGIAAFILLLFQPTILFDVGFQLSFAAVFGIFVIYPVSGHLVQTGNKIPDMAWKVSCVAFAAQLFTFPLSLFYFNQFPNYFLLSNLAIVPTSTLAMYTSLANLCTSWVPILNLLMGKLAGYSIWLMNACIFFTEGLPNATTRFLYVSVVETFLIYLIIGSLLVALLHRRLLFLKFAFVLACLYGGGRLVRNGLIHSQESAIVYRIPGNTLIGYFKGEQGTFWGNQELITNQAKLHYHIDRHIAMLGLKDVRFLPLPDTTTMMFQQQVGNKKLLIVNRLPKEKIQIDSKLSADLVLFRDLPHYRKMDWCKQLKASVWVVDASVLKPKNKTILEDKKTWQILREGPYVVRFD
jgi:competence protein ComEC